MIADLRSGEATELTADVCIIGAGAAGIALAREFLGTSHSVLMLETGGFAFDPDAHALGEGEATGLRFNGFQDGRFRGFGGTTRTWGGQCVEMDPSDFMTRSWVPDSGWPITYDELEPYYRRAESVLHVAGETYDEAIWRRFGLEPPRFDPSFVTPRFTVMTPRPDLARVYRAELNDASNITVCLHAHALQLVWRQRAVSSVDVAVVGSSKRLSVRARIYVLASGGLESARLLLLSTGDGALALGNEHGNVGRYYQDHPNAHVGTIETHDARFLQDRFGLLYRGRVRYFPKLQLATPKQHGDRVLNAIANLIFEYDDKAVQAMRSFANALRRRRPPERFAGQLIDLIAGSSNSAHMLLRRYALGRSPALKPDRIVLQIHTEQAPNPDSRVLLGDALDTFAQRRIRVDWRLSDLERQTFATLTDAIATEFTRLGLGSVSPAEWMRGSGNGWAVQVSDAYHHIGATRMSTHPPTGVVDRTLRIHSVDNAYIASSSAFPTSGYANPTLTIVALALRLADTLKRGELLRRT